MSDPAWNGEPIRVGVLADTHFNGKGDPEPIRRALGSLFAGANLILHAGDIIDFDWMTREALPETPIMAVAGNCDDADDPRLPVRRILEIGGFRIGLMHGWGAPAGLTDRLVGVFRDLDVAAVVFGHSHQPFLASIGGITYFNPGSPTEPRASAASVGLLTVTPGQLQWRHIQLEPWR